MGFSEHGNGVEIHYLDHTQIHPHGPTTHTEHVLAYHVAGKVRLEQGSIMTAEPGQITLLPAGVPHCSLGVEQAELWLVSFCAPCLQLSEQSPLMEAFTRVRAGAHPVIAVEETRREKWLRLLEDLHEEQRLASPESHAAVQALLTLLLTESIRALRASQKVSGQGHTGLTTQALRFIQTHCLTPISLKDVAEAVHRAPAHVAATVKKETGFSVGNWIQAGRLGEAARRLNHTEDSMLEITHAVGWQDVTHFIRCFRKAFGRTPAAWRAEMRDLHRASSPARPSPDQGP